MKYKLQIEKLKQIMQTTEENLRMKLDARDLEIVALKDALFIRNQMIQRLDTTIADLNTELNDRENQLERRDIMIKDLDGQITVLKSEIEKKEVAIYQWKGAVNDLESEKQTLTEIADSATARLNYSTDFNIKLHVKNRDLRNEIERECKNFGEFIGHNFSTTNHAEKWECDNTHELYDIEELYAKYVQHTQAWRV